MTTETKTETKQLDRLTNANHVAWIGEKWRRLVFTESGKARLAYIVGWLEQLAETDSEQAELLATDLCKQFDYLNSYGGELDIGNGCNVPGAKVLLGDDGCLGSFALLWFRAVNMSDICNHCAKSVDDSIPESTDEWTAAYTRNLARFREENGIDENMTERRAYRPDWWNDDDSIPPYPSEYAQYVRWFNGGLIYHFGDDRNSGSWSIHT
jgi:hypothetical protein